RSRCRGGLLMRSVTYSMGSHLTVTSSGRTATSTGRRPTEEVFRFVTGEIGEVGVHLLGRRLYETMLYWETRRPGSIARRLNARVGLDLEAAPKGGVLHHAIGGAVQCPPGLRRSWRRRSSGCEPSRGRAISRSAARLSPPRRP